jgi:hypothetical protein
LLLLLFDGFPSTNSTGLIWSGDNFRKHYAFTTVCSTAGKGGSVVSAMVAEVMIVKWQTKNVLTYCCQNEQSTTVLGYSLYSIICVNSYTGQPGSGTING